MKSFLYKNRHLRWRCHSWRKNKQVGRLYLIGLKQCYNKCDIFNKIGTASEHRAIITISKTMKD